jgi:hypothetical protein
MVGAGDLDIADLAFDDAKSNHAVDNVLVWDHDARVAASTSSRMLDRADRSLHSRSPDKQTIG